MTVFHDFRTGPDFQFFDGPNLNPYRPKSGPWIEPSNGGPKLGFLKSEPRTEIRAGF